MSKEKNDRRLDDDILSKDELLHELQVNQIELEMQNNQLREVQQQLEESRDRYADLYDNAPVGYMTLDENGVVLEINLTGAAMLGIERLNIVGRPFMVRLADTSINIFAGHLKQAFTSHENTLAELQVRVGKVAFHILTLESVVMRGETRLCRTVMRDITLRHKIASELQVNRAAQDALLKTIPALVFYIDDNQRVLNVSQTFSDFVGQPREKLTGHTFHDFLPTGVADDFKNTSTSVLQTGLALYGFEHSMQIKNDGIAYMSTVLAPYRDDRGNIIGLVGVCIDITNIRNAANLNSDLLMQNRQLTRQLFAAQEEERRVLARELHDELGQWFTAIQAEAQIICNVAKHLPEIHTSALSISNSAGKVHEVIRGMMRNLRPSLLDELGLEESLREMVRQWCAIHPGIACDLKLEMSLNELGEELNLTVYRLIQEALNNVASHSKAHKLVLSLKKELDTERSINLLTLCIEDDGTGFDSKSTRAGVGLLGMRERVIAVGGDFYIESAPGSGTKILAKLPLGKLTRSGS